MEQTIAQIVQELYDQDVSVVLTRPDSQFGDYATNVALQLAKPLGRSPREIAEEIAARLQDLGSVQSVSVAGPGFINIRVDEVHFIELIGRPFAASRQGQVVVAETNNPNPFKAVHIGHALNAILADTIANLLDASGAEVHRVSYHGDVGAHVGKVMYSLLAYTQGDIRKLLDVAEFERNSFVSRMYAEGARAYETDEQAKQQIQQLAKQSFDLEDEHYRAVYELCKGWSFEQIDAVVDKLGNRPIEKRYLESQADPVGVQTVMAHTPEVFQQSEGAYVFEGSKHGAFDNVFVNSQGQGLYAARDLGLMQLKDNDFHADRSYIVTAEEQRDYFKGVIAAAELCLPQLAGVTQNITHGMLKLSTGKMSSRTGDVVEIEWLFEQMRQAIRERGGEPTDELVAGALRYQFLKSRIGGDIVFDVNESVSLQGNTGSYLQYAHARAASILAKAEGEAVLLEGQEFDGPERQLLVKMSQLVEIVDRAARELAPQGIATYLYELAQQFNQFYEAARIIGDERQAVRLWLVEQYRSTLARGLMVLGIVAPDRM